MVYALCLIFLGCEGYARFDMESFTDIFLFDKKLFVMRICEKGCGAVEILN